MPDFLVENNILQGTATPDTPIAANPVYEPRGIFSINASNMLRGTFWITKSGEKQYVDLSTASYTIYDADGISVGITESSISANANADYVTTPVLASAIQDLTHYTVKIDIYFDGQLRRGQVGITLGE